MNFKSLVVVFLFAFCAVTHAAHHKSDGFKPIFDGKTLTGWSCLNMSYWSVEDGAITAKATEENPCKKNQFLVWDQGELDDFELKLKFRINGSAKANAGVQIRSQIAADGHASGYQCDIDQGGNWIGALYDEHTGRRILAKRGQKTVITADGKRTTTAIGGFRELTNLKPNVWHDYHISARGTRIVLKVDGQVTADVTDNETAHRDLIGKLAVQLHSGPPMVVQYKDIMLKRLPLADGRKKVVFLAGNPSHRPGDHEHNAGCLLLAKCLNENASDKVVATVYRNNGWPADPTAFDNINALITYSDGNARHPVIKKLKEVDAMAKNGVGIGFIHYAVEVPKGEAGQYFIDWTGGVFEIHFSVNPHWDAEFKALPKHPIANGVKPFKINDEWYFNMRFVSDMKASGVVPILTAVAPESTMARGDGHHSGNPEVRKLVSKKAPMHVMWSRQRKDGGRGFGFTGGHFHKNWGDPNHRGIVLNAITWVAGADVPASGVPSKVTADDLARNLDKKGVRKPKPKKKKPEQKKK